MTTPNPQGIPVARCPLVCLEIQWVGSPARRNCGSAPTEGGSAVGTGSQEPAPALSGRRDSCRAHGKALTYFRLVYLMEFDVSVWRRLCSRRAASPTTVPALVICTALLASVRASL